MIATEDILKRKYITPNPDPILLALGEHLDLERCGHWDKIKASDKVCLLWNIGVKRPQNRELWFWMKEHSKPCYCVERASLPNMSMIDPNGMLADSTSYDGKRWNHPLNDEQHNAVTAYVKGHCSSECSLEKQCSLRMNKDAFMNTVGRKWKQIVFVPLQHGTDTTILMWSRWVQSVENFVKMIYILANHHPEILFVMKPHPVSKDKTIPLIPNVFNAINLHYKDCLAYCDKVYTINSGVGLQAMMWGKPTYVFGQSHYSFKDINKSIDDSDQAEFMLNDNYQVDMEKVYRYIHYVRFILWSDVDLSNGSTPCYYTRIRMI